jgi:hypothetical protein
MMNRNVTRSKKRARLMRFIRDALIACLAADFIVFPGTLLVGMPVTLFAEQSGQERALKATPPDVRRAGGALGAAGGAPPGSVHLGLNLSHIRFSDDVADTSHTESGGYVGVLGYGRLFHGLYLGGEVGKAENATLFSGDDVEFLPIELNAKYAFQAGSHFVLDVGGRLSYSYVEIKPGEEWNLGCTFYICPAPEPSRANGDDAGTTDDWLLGGQLFAEMMFRMGWFSLGFNGKYQITEEFKDSDLALDNWRVGIVTIFRF